MDSKCKMKLSLPKRPTRSVDQLEEIIASTVQAYKDQNYDQEVIDKEVARMRERSNKLLNGSELKINNANLPKPVQINPNPIVLEFKPTDHVANLNRPRSAMKRYDEEHINRMIKRERKKEQEEKERLIQKEAEDKEKERLRIEAENIQKNTIPSLVETIVTKRVTRPKPSNIILEESREYEQESIIQPQESIQKRMVVKKMEKKEIPIVNYDLQATPFFSNSDNSTPDKTENENKIIEPKNVVIQQPPEIKKSESDFLNAKDKEINELLKSNPRLNAYMSYRHFTYGRKALSSEKATLSFINDNMKFFDTISSDLLTDPYVVIRRDFDSTLKKVTLAEMAAHSGDFAFYLLGADTTSMYNLMRGRGDIAEKSDNLKRQRTLEKSEYNANIRKSQENLRNDKFMFLKFLRETVTVDGIPIDQIFKMSDVGDPLHYYDVNDKIPLATISEVPRHLKINNEDWVIPGFSYDTNVPIESLKKGFANSFIKGFYDEHILSTIVNTGDHKSYETFNYNLDKYRVDSGDIPQFFARFAELFKLGCINRRVIREPKSIELIKDLFNVHSSFHFNNSREILFLNNMNPSLIFINIMDKLHYTMPYGFRKTKLPNNPKDFYLMQGYDVNGDHVQLVNVNGGAKGNPLSDQKRDITFITEYLQHVDFMASLHNITKTISHSPYTPGFYEELRTKVFSQQYKEEKIKIDALLKIVKISSKYEIIEKEKNSRLYEPTFVAGMIGFQFLCNLFMSNVKNVRTGNTWNLMGLQSSGSDITKFIEIVRKKQNRFIAHYSDNIYIVDQGYFVSTDVVKMDANHTRESMFAVASYIVAQTLDESQVKPMLALLYFFFYEYSDKDALVCLDHASVLVLKMTGMLSGCGGTFLLNHLCTAVMKHVLDSHPGNLFDETNDGVLSFTPEVANLLAAAGFSLKISKATKLELLNKPSNNQVIEIDMLGYGVMINDNNQILPIFEHGRIWKSLAFSKTRSQNPIVKMFTSLCKANSLWDQGGWFYDDLRPLLYNHMYRLGRNIENSIVDNNIDQIQEIMKDLESDKISFESYLTSITSLKPKGVFDLVFKYNPDFDTSLLPPQIGEHVKLNLFDLTKVYPNSLFENMFFKLKSGKEKIETWRDLLSNVKRDKNLKDFSTTIDADQINCNLNNMLSVNKDKKIVTIKMGISEKLYPDMVEDFIMEKQYSTNKEHSIGTRLNYLIRGISNVSGMKVHTLINFITEKFNTQIQKKNSELFMLYMKIKDTSKKNKIIGKSSKEDKMELSCQYDAVSATIDWDVPYNRAMDLEPQHKHNLILWVLKTILSSPFKDCRWFHQYEGSISTPTEKNHINVCYQLLISIITRFYIKNTKVAIECVKKFVDDLMTSPKYAGYTFRIMKQTNTHYEGFNMSDEERELIITLFPDKYSQDLALLTDNSTPLSLKKMIVKQTEANYSAYTVRFEEDRYKFEKEMSIHTKLYYDKLVAKLPRQRFYIFYYLYKFYYESDLDTLFSILMMLAGSMNVYDRYLFAITARTFLENPNYVIEHKDEYVKLFNRLISRMNDTNAYIIYEELFRTAFDDFIKFYDNFDNVKPLTVSETIDKIIKEVNEKKIDNIIAQHIEKSKTADEEEIETRKQSKFDIAASNWDQIKVPSMSDFKQKSKPKSKSKDKDKKESIIVTQVRIGRDNKQQAILMKTEKRKIVKTKEDGLKGSAMIGENKIKIRDDLIFFPPDFIKAYDLKIKTDDVKNLLKDQSPTHYTVRVHNDSKGAYIDIHIIKTGRKLRFALYNDVINTYTPDHIVNYFSRYVMGFDSYHERGDFVVKFCDGYGYRLTAAGIMDAINKQFNITQKWDPVSPYHVIKIGPYFTNIILEDFKHLEYDYSNKMLDTADIYYLPPDTTVDEFSIYLGSNFSYLNPFLDASHSFSLFWCIKQRVPLILYTLEKLKDKPNFGNITALELFNFIDSLEKRYLPLG